MSGMPNIETDYHISEAGCWIWNGRIDRNGYGKAYDETRPRGKRVDWAHRVSYRRHRGEIPLEHDLDHICEVTACVNPAHLEPVTKAEHARRTMARLGKDALHGRAATMRAMGLTYAEIADVLEYGSRSSAANAVRAAVTKGLVDPEAVPPRRLLDGEDREDIRALYALGVPQPEIAAWYDVDSSQVSRICAGRTSGHSRRAS